MFGFNFDRYQLLLQIRRTLTMVFYMSLPCGIALFEPLPLVVRQVSNFLGLSVFIFASFIWIPLMIIRWFGQGLGLREPYLLDLYYLLEYRITPPLDRPWQRFFRTLD